MKFCDKLAFIRKKNNLSQEQLADRIGVSRQAVSKWEAGSTYPDMSKIILMCEILDCTLEDLMDDGTISGNTDKDKGVRFSLSNSIHDLLSFITKTYNMFCSMRFKDRIKCLLEIVFISFLLFILSAIVFAVLTNLTTSLFSVLPFNYEYYLVNIFKVIYLIVLIILSCVILFHLFKIRYLDYYITIEDNSAKDKSVEVPIDCFNDNRKEKVIIRDPKHSTFSFVDVLIKIVVFLLKVFLLFIFAFAIIGFVFSVGLFVFTICHTIYNILGLYISISIFGVSLIIYIFLEMIYRFIVNKNMPLKRIFVMFIFGLILFGVGGGLTFIKIMKLDYIDDYSVNAVDTKYIEYSDDLIINSAIADSNVTYIVDNTIDNIRIDILYDKSVGYTFGNFDNNYYICSNNYTIWKFYDAFLENIKNNKIRSYGYSDFILVNIYAKSEVLDSIKSN